MPGFRKSKHLASLLLLLAVAVSPAMAYFKLSDAQGPLGTIHTVYITTDELPSIGTSVELKLGYQAEALAFVGLGEGNMMMDKNSSVTTGLDGSQQTMIVFGTVLNNDSDTLISLRFRSLVGAGDAALITLDDASVGGQQLDKSQYEGSGTINIEGDRVVELIAQSDISPPYPNPFGPSTQVKFSLGADSPIEFKIFTTSGVELASIPYTENEEAQQGFGYQLLTEGSVQEWKVGTVMPEGNYTLQLFPNPQNSASGLYILSMATATERFTIGLIHVK